MDCNFSIIIPTCGRRSLQRTLRSIREQRLADGDEVLLVTDGPQPLATELFAASGLRGQCIETVATRDFGASQRNRAMDLARGSYLLFMDDDDIFVPDAFETIRAAVQAAPGRPHLFRMCYARNGGVLWANQKLELGNISTVMIVFPNHARLQRWDRRHGHDFRFVVNNLPLWPPNALVWREEVIALVRPHEGDPISRIDTNILTTGSRRVEDCPHRDSIHAEETDGPASCRLLGEIIGAEESQWHVVRRDACEACCASSSPSSFDINRVIASLLYDLTDQIVARGGVAGCDADRAAGLQDWAEVHLGLDPPPEPSVSIPARALGPCCYLGTTIGFRVQTSACEPSRLPVFACHHPGHRETTLDECHRCRDWSDHSGLIPVPLERLIPPPAERQGPEIRRWAVGVTTAPRRQSTLEWRLDSLIRAGWEEPRLFVDSAVTVSERFAGLPVSLRETKLGAWPNYYLALAELLMREPEADAFLLVQDDVVLYDRYNLRVYLEQCLWPSNPVGAVSLFCSSAYTRLQFGWHRQEERWVCGAQAFIFPRESAKRFIADPLVLEHRWSHQNRGLANIDTVIGQWACRHGLPIYYPTPSLAQHVGDASTL